MNCVQTNKHRSILETVMFENSNVLFIVTAITLATVIDAAPALSQGASFVVPNTEAPLRASPPGFFAGKGAKVGATVAGEKYMIVEEKLVPSIFGTQKWIKIIEDKPAASPGWAYSGTSGAMKNFKKLQ